MKIQRVQIARIKILQKDLGLADEEYRALLRQYYEVESCTLLSRAQADDFIAVLGRGGRRSFSEQGRAGGWPYTDMDGRPGMASGKQLRMLMAMWSEVSDASAREREARFDHFLQSRFGLAGYTWLEDKDVSRVARAFVAMRQQKARSSAASHGLKARDAAMLHPLGAVE